MLPRSGSAAVPDRDNLPLKKREQRWNSPSFQRQQEQQCDAATFKVPYPHRSCTETRPKHASPFHPFPKRVAALHQPWIHAYTPTSLMPQGVSAFRAHQGWTDCRESKAPCLGWERAHYFQHHSHLSPLIDVGQHPSRLRTGSWTGDAFQSVGDWQQLRGRKSNAWWKSDERNGGPYLKRNRKSESLSHAGYLALSTGPRPSTEQLLQTSPKLPSTSSSGHSFTKDSKLSSAHVSAREEASGFPSPYSPSPNRLPWLLPHFLAGSLIELRDGQLRRVEHLQTEDFLLGALACPDLRLSCCTVQSITPSASSSISRLLILLHDQQSQELVDVYVEYPFFVQDQGWSSCSPQRTARLCGLQCRQLSVGDVCLALTPLSAPRRPLPAELGPKATTTLSEQAQESSSAPGSRVPRGLGQPAGEQRQKQVRRRHRSAPELRGGRTRCAS